MSPNDPEPLPAPQKEITSSPQDLLPMRGFAGSLLSIRIGRAAHRVYPPLLELLTKHRSVGDTSTYPALTQAMLPAVREAFSATGAGKPGTLAPGQVILLAALATLKGGGYLRQLMLTEAPALKGEKGSMQPTTQPYKAMLASLAVRLPEDEQARAKTAEKLITRVYDYLLSPRFQAYSNVDDFVRALATAASTEETEPEQSISAVPGYLISSALSAGPLPPMALETPTVSATARTYIEQLQEKIPDWDDKTSKAEAHQHVRRMFEASAIVGAMGLLVSEYLQQIKQTLDPKRSLYVQVREKLFEGIEQGRPLVMPQKIIITAHATDKERTTPALASFEMEITPPPATAADPLAQNWVKVQKLPAPVSKAPSIRVVGRAGESTIETEYPVAPGAFFGFVPHATEHFEARAGKFAPDAVLQHVTGAFQQQFGEGLSQYVRTLAAIRTDREPMAYTFASPEGLRTQQHSRAQLLFDTAMRVVQYVTGANISTPFSQVIRYERIPPNAMRKLEEMHGFEDLQQAMKETAMHRLWIVAPFQVEGGQQLVAIISAERAGQEAEVNVEVHEKLPEPFAQIVPEMVAPEMVTAAGEQVRPDKPVAIVEPAQFSTRVHPYGLRMGPYLGTGQRKEEMRPYYVFNVPYMEPESKAMKIDAQAPWLYQVIARQVLKEVLKPTSGVES